jgi:hypothetical protein
MTDSMRIQAHVGLQSFSSISAAADERPQPGLTAPRQAEPAGAPVAKRARIDGATGPTPAAPQRPAPPASPSVTELWNALPRDIWENIFKQAHRLDSPDGKKKYCYSPYGQYKEVYLACSSRSPYAAWSAPDSRQQTMRIHHQSAWVADGRDPRAPLEFFRDKWTQARLPFAYLIIIGGAKLAPTDMPELWSHLSQHARGLKRLSIDSCPQLAPKDLEGLAVFSNLHQLTLPGDASHLNDQSLSVIGGLTTLRSLQLVGGHMDGRVDDLEPTAITAEGVKNLAGLRQLEMLLINGNTLHVDALRPLYDLKRLQKLGVENWQGMTRRKMTEIASHFPRLHSAWCTLVVKTQFGLAQKLFLWFPKNSRYVGDPNYLEDIKFRPLLIPDDSEIEYSPCQQ